MILLNVFDKRIRVRSELLSSCLYFHDNLWSQKFSVSVEYSFFANVFTFFSHRVNSWHICPVWNICTSIFRLSHCECLCHSSVFVEFCVYNFSELVADIRGVHFGAQIYVSTFSMVGRNGCRLFPKNFSKILYVSKTHVFVSRVYYQYDVHYSKHFEMFLSTPDE